MEFFWGGLLEKVSRVNIIVRDGKSLLIILIPALTVTHPHMSNIWCDSEHWEFPGMHKDDK